MEQHAVTPFNVVSLMNATEACECVTKINSHMNSARALLLDLYERRGWQALGYQSWRECVTAEFAQSKSRLYQELEAAQIEQRISTNGGIGSIPERQLRPLAALTPMEQPIAWQEAQERSGGKPTARVVEEVVREMRADSPAKAPEPEPAPADTLTVAEIAADIDDVLDPPMEPAQVADLRAASRINAGLFTSTTPEWYTPKHIIERVIRMLGTIDLDPCSNSATAPNVPAENHYTKDDDGLTQPWFGRVYMNPPYGDEISAWVKRLFNAYENEEISEGIALLPGRPDTAWFQDHLADCRWCWVRGRLRFSSSENGAPFPSIVVYFGKRDAQFWECFGDIGLVR